jgi:hypothetical protein
MKFNFCKTSSIELLFLNNSFFTEKNRFCEFLSFLPIRSIGKINWKTQVSASRKRSSDFKLQEFGSTSGIIQNMVTHPASAKMPAGDLFFRPMPQLPAKTKIELPGYGYLFFGLITAMIGRTIHYGYFWTIMDFIFWPAAWCKWLIYQEVNLTIIKQSFCFLLQ